MSLRSLSTAIIVQSCPELGPFADSWIWPATSLPRAGFFFLVSPNPERAGDVLHFTLQPCMALTTESLTGLPEQKGSHLLLVPEQVNVASVARSWGALEVLCAQGSQVAFLGMVTDRLDAPSEFACLQHIKLPGPPPCFSGGAGLSKFATHQDPLLFRWGWSFHICKT